MTVRMQTDLATLGNSFPVPYKVNMHLPITFPLLDISKRNENMFTQKLAYEC